MYPSGACGIVRKAFLDMDQTVTEPLHLISKHFVGPTPAGRFEDLRRHSQKSPLGSGNKLLS